MFASVWLLQSVFLLFLGSLLFQVLLRQQDSASPSSLRSRITNCWTVQWRVRVNRLLITTTKACEHYRCRRARRRRFFFVSAGSTCSAGLQQQQPGPSPPPSRIASGHAPSEKVDDVQRRLGKRTVTRRREVKREEAIGRLFLQGLREHLRQKRPPRHCVDSLPAPTWW